RDVLLWSRVTLLKRLTFPIDLRNDCGSRLVEPMPQRSPSPFADSEHLGRCPAAAHFFSCWLVKALGRINTFCATDIPPGTQWLAGAARAACSIRLTRPDYYVSFGLRAPGGDKWRIVRFAKSKPG